jgi:hypothetical protein
MSLRSSSDKNGMCLVGHWALVEVLERKSDRVVVAVLVAVVIPV